MQKFGFPGTKGREFDGFPLHSGGAGQAAKTEESGVGQRVGWCDIVFFFIFSV